MNNKNYIVINHHIYEQYQIKIIEKQQINSDNINWIIDILTNNPEVIYIEKSSGDFTMPVSLYSQRSSFINSEINKEKEKEKTELKVNHSNDLSTLKSIKDISHINLLYDYNLDSQDINDLAESQIHDYCYESCTYTHNGKVIVKNNSKYANTKSINYFSYNLILVSATLILFKKMSFF